MNEDLLKRIEKLETENQELLAWKKNMSASHSIPLENDQAFRKRFENLGSSVNITGTGTYGTDAMVLAGDPPYNFTQPDQPSGTVKVTINGVEYEFLIK